MLSFRCEQRCYLRNLAFTRGMIWFQWPISFFIIPDLVTSTNNSPDYPLQALPKEIDLQTDTTHLDIRRMLAECLQSPFCRQHEPIQCKHSRKLKVASMKCTSEDPAIKNNVNIWLSIRHDAYY